MTLPVVYCQHGKPKLHPMLHGLLLRGVVPVAAMPGEHENETRLLIDNDEFVRGMVLARAQGIPTDGTGTAHGAVQAVILLYGVSALTPEGFAAMMPQENAEHLLSIAEADYLRLNAWYLNSGGHCQHPPEHREKGTSIADLLAHG